MQFPFAPPGWAYYITRASGHIVAAGALRPGEYVFCRRGVDDGLDAAADVGAGRFELDNRPSNEWDEIDTFRALYFGVGRGHLEASVVDSDWASVELTPEVVLDHVVSMVASDLPEATDVTTYCWPSRTAETRTIQPDPQVRRLLFEAEEQHRRHQEVAQAERDAARLDAEVAREAAAADAERAAVEARLADTDEFTCDDLLAAARGSGRSHLEDWGATVLNAFEALQRDRTRRTADRALLDVLRRTAALRYQPVSPFEGMLEAPQQVNDFYVSHAPHLDRLITMRDKVLDDVLSDVTWKLLEMLPGDPPRWGELAQFGALREQPPYAAYDDLDQF